MGRRRGEDGGWRALLRRAEGSGHRADLVRACNLGHTAQILQRMGQGSQHEMPRHAMPRQARFPKPAPRPRLLSMKGILLARTLLPQTCERGGRNSARMWAPECAGGEIERRAFEVRHRRTEVPGETYREMANCRRCQGLDRRAWCPRVLSKRALALPAAPAEALMAAGHEKTNRLGLGCLWALWPRTRITNMPDRSSCT